MKDFIKKIIKVLFKATVIIHVVFIIVIFFAMIYLKKNNPKTISLMLYRQHYTGYKIKPVKFLPLGLIPNDIKKMAIATEDYRFYSHHGIDPEAIKRAYFINKKVGYRMYGGSTITQQLSRTLFLMPKKLLIRKYIEVLISLEMDLILSKDRILELYLNYCEWGQGFFGIAQASENYFKKSVYKLTVDETARLITILANPVDYGPYSFEKKKFLANRYYIIKFRYYTYTKFQNIKRPGQELLTSSIK